MTAGETGKLGEEYTAEALRKNGFEILERNFRIRGGEIDIIAEKGDIIHFVEVKTRKRGSLESGDEALDSRKQALIARAAAEYLRRSGSERSCVFDAAIVAVSGGRVTGFRYIARAFTA